MTLIIASLFLPYQPQFEVDDAAAASIPATELADTKLVKVTSNESMMRRRRSSVASLNSMHGLLRLSVPPGDNAKSVPVPAALTVGASTTGNLGSSTATAATGASASVDPIPGVLPNLSFREKPAGVEDLFSSPVSPTGTKSAREPSISPNTQHAQLRNDLDDILGPTDVVSNLRRESRGSFLPLVGSPTTPDSGSPFFFNQTPLSKGAVVTPKSRLVPTVSSAVIDFAKVRQKQQQMRSSLPSMRRVSVGSKKMMKNLVDRSPIVEEKEKERETEAGTATATATETGIEMEMETGFNREETPQPQVKQGFDNAEDVVDPDFEVEMGKKYYVPQFGGYSKRGRDNFLKTSQELFGQLPWKIVPSLKGNINIKNAVDVAMQDNIVTESVNWVGTVGIPTDEIPADITQKIARKLADEYSCTAVLTDDITFKGAYKNFSKKILWPTLHYIIPDNPNSKAFEGHSWNYYQKLNQQFADKIVSLYKEGDTIWIHDYHLLLVPAMVRKQLPRARIGFYLHVSFPSSEVFRVFAQREKILEGMLGASTVCFQTKEYVRHFLQTVTRLLMADVSTDSVGYNGQIIPVKNVPLGVDYFSLVDQLQTQGVSYWRSMIRQRWQGRKLIVCRDQYDKIRGLDRKMLGYERFLRENPEYIDKIVLIQICNGRLENPELERQIMMIVDRINSMSTDISAAQPVVFLHQDLDLEQFLALNCEADLFMITSLREGMNLTSHTFVACSSEKHAPLLLSEFTGSASVLNSGSVLINPWDTRQIANSIKYALDMTPNDKRREWKKLVRSVINNDSDNWIRLSLQYINSAWEFTRERSSYLNLSFKGFREDYLASKKHLFIFKISDPPTSRIVSMLNDLSSNSIVFVMSSARKSILQNHYSRALNIGLIAENGAYVRLNGTWYNIVEHVDWIPEVVKILDDKVERLPGSYYKIVSSMIRFHTENADDKDRVTNVVGDAITHINTLFEKRDVRAYLHKNIMFVQEADLSVSALKFILRFYNTSSDPSDNTQIPVTAPVRDTTFNTSGNSQNHIDFACISGSSSPVIEPLFKLINQETENKNLKVGYTIVYGDPVSTYAKDRVGGLNVFLSMINRVTQ